MGVKLRELIPREDLDFDDLKGKKIAVDFSNAVYQFLSSIRQLDGTPLMDSKGNITSHLQGLFSRTANLMTRGIKICYVFDGKPPALKVYEKEHREHKKRIAEGKLEAAREEGDVEAMAKYSKQSVRLNTDMIKESKELIKALGLPLVQAPSEADAQMAFMCEKNDVWAVASSDHDSLLHGAPRMIPNLTLSTRKKLPSGKYINIKPEIIFLDRVLEHLKINRDQLIAISILTGTDYNRGGVKGIGPKTALKLVREIKSFDELFKEVKADFNWKQIFAIFKSMSVMKNYQLKWSEVDVEGVKKILVDRHEFNEERIDNTLDKLKSSEQKGLDAWVK